jgi:uncharacterized protein with FMN-binding domain
MSRILLGAGKIGIIGFTGIILCVSCMFTQVKIGDQYETLYKTTVRSQDRADGTHTTSTMPFYQGENLRIAIEWQQSPARTFYHFTMLHSYRQEKVDVNDVYFMNDLGVQINNGRVASITQIQGSKEWRGTGDTVNVVETMIVPLEPAMVQSLRDSTALSLTVLGAPRAVSAEALEKLKEFIRVHAAR